MFTKKWSCCGSVIKSRIGCVRADHTDSPAEFAVFQCEKLPLEIVQLMDIQEESVEKDRYIIYKFNQSFNGDDEGGGGNPETSRHTFGSENYLQNDYQFICRVDRFKTKPI